MALASNSKGSRRRDIIDGMLEQAQTQKVPSLEDDPYYIPTVPRFRLLGVEHDDTIGDHFFDIYPQGGLMPSPGLNTGDDGSKENRLLRKHTFSNAQPTTRIVSGRMKRSPSMQELVIQNRLAISQSVANAARANSAATLATDDAASGSLRQRRPSVMEALSDKQQHPPEPVPSKQHSTALPSASVRQTRASLLREKQQQQQNPKMTDEEVISWKPMRKMSFLSINSKQQEQQKPVKMKPAEVVAPSPARRARPSLLKNRSTTMAAVKVEQPNPALATTKLKAVGGPLEKCKQEVHEPERSSSSSTRKTRASSTAMQMLEPEQKEPKPPTAAMIDVAPVKPVRKPRASLLKPGRPSVSSVISQNSITTSVRTHGTSINGNDNNSGNITTASGGGGPAAAVIAKRTTGTSAAAVGYMAPTVASKRRSGLFDVFGRKN